MAPSGATTFFNQVKLRAGSIEASPVGATEESRKIPAGNLEFPFAYFLHNEAHLGVVVVGQQQSRYDLDR